MTVRQTPKRYFNIFAMLLVSVLLLNQNNLFAQQKEGTQGTNKPQIHINVHKKTDKNGNIIGYDSTYTYYYKNDGNSNPPKGFNPDSVFNHMGDNFMNNGFFSNPFANDPFFQGFDNNMMPLFQNMDSLMNHFLNQFQQPQMQPQKSKPDSSRFKQSLPQQNEQKNTNQKEYHL